MSTKPSLSLPPELALTSLALMWGTSHVITKSILTTHSPAFYTSMRFGIASVCFGILFAKNLRQSNAGDIKRGIILGLCSFAGIGLYVMGLMLTQASKAGFITGLYLVFTPVMAFALFRSRPTRDHLVGLVTAVIGFTLLSFPAVGGDVNWGDLLVLLAAVAWGAHIAATSAFAKISDIKTLAAIQVATVATLAYLTYFFLVALGMETQPNTIDWSFALRIGYIAVVVTFIAALLQTWAQRQVASTHAAIFYALEPVTAALFAYFAFGELLGWRQGVGAALIVAGVIASKLDLASRVTGVKSNELENSRFQGAESDSGV
jgi:drug/metabolite transporter (DMT)-like permease